MKQFESLVKCFEPVDIGVNGLGCEDALLDLIIVVIFLIQDKDSGLLTADVDDLNQSALEELWNLHLLVLNDVAKGHHQYLAGQY